MILKSDFFQNFSEKSKNHVFWQNPLKEEHLGVIEFAEKCKILSKSGQGWRSPKIRGFQEKIFRTRFTLQNPRNKATLKVPKSSILGMMKNLKNTKHINHFFLHSIIKRKIEVYFICLAWNCKKSSQHSFFVNFIHSCIMCI